MSAQVAARRWQLAVRMMVVASVWSLGLLLAALLVPAYNGNTDSQQNGVTLTRLTLVQDKGAWALALVAVPVLASAAVAAAIVYRRRDDAVWAAPVAWTAVGVLTVVSLLGITTLGAFMLPVAVVLALSVRLAPGWGDVRVVPERPASRARAASEDGRSTGLATGT